MKIYSLIIGNSASLTLHLLSKTYVSLLVVIMCLMLNTAWSQVPGQKPVYLGKVADLVASFEGKFNARTRNVTFDNQITHSLPAQSALVLQVKAHQRVGTVEVYAGEVALIKNSSFFLQVNDKELSGYIILRDQKKAYQYSSNNGLAYLQEVDINKVICIDYPTSPKSSTSNQPEQGAVQAAAIPNLQSLPGARAVVLLDFDGQFVFNLIWSLLPIDAKPPRLTEREMREAWEIMSEDFRPFNINITTSEAVFNRAPANRRMRVIFTRTKDWLLNSDDIGGIALLGSFTLGTDTPCWVFNESGKTAGEAGSHEVGHTLGLSHDGRRSTNKEYYSGHGNWAPIMGVGYNKEQVQWSKGEYPSANNTEDDLAIITSQAGINYRTDDHSNGSSGATPIIKDVNGTLKFNRGIVASRGDVDVFSFSTSGGPVNLTVNPSPRHANLDVHLILKNASLTTLMISDPATISATINLALPAGTYYLFINGAKGDLGANSDYGSLGEYSITGNVPPDGVIVMSSTPKTTCSDTFFDPGYLGNYPASLNIIQTFSPAILGNRLRFTFFSFNLADPNDRLFVYDGANTNAPLIGSFSGTTIPVNITATNPAGKLTFRFTSNAFLSGSGWKAAISCLPIPGVFVMKSTTITTCSGTFYDPGYLGNYPASLNTIQTFSPAILGNRLRFTFSSFNLADPNDRLFVYDGANTNAPLIGSFSGTNNPGTIIATNAAGKLTLRFTSNAALSASGWKAAIACVSPLAAPRSPETDGPPLALTAQPNPFTNKVTLFFVLPQPQAVSLQVFDLQGNLTASLYEGEIEANKPYSFEFAKEGMQPGIYVVRLVTPDKVHSIKLLRGN